jgi:hypothetical protein
MKPGVMRHDEVACLLIANHDAFLPLDQVERHQQTQASMQSVLITLTRRSVLGSVVDPLSDVRKSVLTERA